MKWRRSLTVKGEAFPHCEVEAFPHCGLLPEGRLHSLRGLLAGRVGAGILASFRFRYRPNIESAKIKSFGDFAFLGG